jgi:hypothetical protein
LVLNELNENETQTNRQWRSMKEAAKQINNKSHSAGGKVENRRKKRGGLNLDGDVYYCRPNEFFLLNLEV